MNYNLSLNHMIENKGSFLFKRFLKAIFIGIGGNIILIVFFISFLNIPGTIRFIPWILAFNAAHTGYSLIGKATSIAYPKLTSALAGFANTMITTGLFAALSVFLLGDLYLEIQDIGIFFTVGVLCSVAGTLLAVKYYKTNIK